ncbi:MAG: NAD(P)H-dependent oxidoreductase subunit E [Erysipelotrichaceae bacterium]|jgi:NADH-quinone oxidoreductase subunit E/NADP-reducing hydrogenase subunit HndA|nr:NAD(P)H-dependent oxidoreductase subunit E [Bacillota bacterium]NLP22641.1 NAD(P)H-dependent oxidoreductase subunit E [Erysipelotrichaceae bacterium]HCY06066.1 NAD(P)H-dependent oxidoreductase subunit E [Erysipelotrichaceae bacterium]
MQKLNQESIDKIDAIIAREKDKMGPVKLMLHEVQVELGYIPFEAMEKISDATGVSVAEIYGVVTFYAQFTTEPKGKHVINVCMGTACYVKGAQNLLDNISKKINCKPNSTSEDGMFSLDATRCIGACGLAPVVVIDGKVYANAVENKEAMKAIDSILEGIKGLS